MTRHVLEIDDLTAAEQQPVTTRHPQWLPAGLVRSCLGADPPP